MRKIATVIFMTAVVILLSVTTLLAGNVERGTDGSLRVKDVIYSPVDITVSKEALPYEMEWKRAVETPGVIVPLITAEGQSQMVDFFHHKTIMSTKTGIVFDEKSKVVEMVKDREMESKVVSNPYFIFWSVSLLSMLVANILYFKRNLTTTFATIFAIVTVVSAFSAFVFAAAVSAVSAFAAVVSAVVSAVAAAAAVAVGSKKAYVILVITYYVLMGVGALVMMASII